MLSFGAATRIWLLAGTTDLRKSFNGLSGLVAQRLEEDPLSGHVFLFCNRERTQLKVLFWDGSGLWVCAKRLEKGSFRWPNAAEVAAGKLSVSAAELALLVGGLDWRDTRQRAWWRR